MRVQEYFFLSMPGLSAFALSLSISCLDTTTFVRPPDSPLASSTCRRNLNISMPSFFRAPSVLRGFRRAVWLDRWKSRFSSCRTVGKAVSDTLVQAHRRLIDGLP
ncbi:hypothetical protein BDZ88DRAFT_186248 [Geranomyces variabilis]|nr:hypothetical protein BDZ88DRAFT_186248 [Geranomyces variabilis]